VELRQLAQLVRDPQPLARGVRAVAERQLEVRRERRLPICPPDLELVRREQELGFIRVERTARGRDLREPGVHAPAVGEVVGFEGGLHPGGLRRHSPLYHWIFDSIESPQHAQNDADPVRIETPALDAAATRTRRPRWHFLALVPAPSRRCSECCQAQSTNNHTGDIH
jgi:hypothetical protein